MPPLKEPPLKWAEKLSISPLLLKIIYNRGFTTFESVKSYLDGSLMELTVPQNWPLIPEAAEILVKELIEGKKFAVWGDYDVDGITAAALVMEILEFHGFKVMHHLPDRRSEGYGLNSAYIEKLAKEGCQTLLTVDCGISDHDAIARAAKLGITVIVSDHHTPPEKLPPAAAIVDPHMKVEKSWPCDCLSGVGVAFYLMGLVNLLLEKHTGRRYCMRNALDLVALGTLADIMPLKGENRILAKAGLKALQKAQRPAIRALKMVSGFEIADTVSSGQAGFRLAPRINAAGRMGHPQAALDLLRCEEPAKALELATILDNYNAKRKTEEDRIAKAAKKQAQELLEKYAYAGLVLYGKDWHPGIIGIVASRVTEEFHRPAIVLCEDGEFIKGSGRSWADFDLYEGLVASSAYLASFGGHKQAAGVRLHIKNLDNFRRAFSDIVKDKLGSVPVPPALTIERELSFAEASDQQFIRELALMEPFGPGNAEPVFASKELLVTKRSFLGHTGEHVLLELQEISSGLKLNAKAWRMAGELPPSMAGKRIRIAFTPHLDYFRGFPSIDLGLKDWHQV